MKKLLLAAILGMIAMTGFANTKNEKIITKEFKKVSHNYPVTITITACGHTGTFSWNATSFGDVVAVTMSVIDVYCQTGNCAP